MHCVVDKRHFFTMRELPPKMPWGKRKLAGQCSENHSLDTLAGGKGFHRRRDLPLAPEPASVLPRF